MSLSIEIPGWQHAYSGKVRDLYAPHDGPTDQILVVASDRISAFDHILPTTIPHKGTILTALTLWWFEQLDVPNHVLSTDVPEQVAGRAMICRKLDMVPVECVARGYLTGSGLAEYQANGTVSGIELPAGLVDGSALPEPIFTPATKAAVGEHDENVTYSDVAAAHGKALAKKLRTRTLELYSHAAQIANERGIILADTKFEFGIDPESGELVLADEALTPDSSRYWPADEWEPGHSQPSYDKQIVRDWLAHESGWDRHSNQPPPSLPVDVVVRTSMRYVEAYERLTGRTF